MYYFKFTLDISSSGIISTSTLEKYFGYYDFDLEIELEEVSGNSEKNLFPLFVPLVLSYFLDVRISSHPYKSIEFL